MCLAFYQLQSKAENRLLTSIPTSKVEALSEGMRMAGALPSVAPYLVNLVGELIMW